MNLSRIALWCVSLIASLGAVLDWSCTPEQWVIQHANKSNYSRGYKYVSVDVERTSVRIRGWSSDSVAIAVHLLEENRAGYSFGVDSIDDTLLLFGKYTGEPGRPGHRPEAILDIPRNADVYVTATGSVHVDGVDGPLHIGASDTVILSSVPRGGIVAGTTAGAVSLEIPGSTDAEVDFESGPGGTVKFESDRFRGTRQSGLARGVLGSGGQKITLKGAKGVEVVFR